MLAFLSIWTERVEATERFMTLKGEPEPPEPPKLDEWRAMQVRLRTYGSASVADAYKLYTEAVGVFFDRARKMRALLDHGEDANEAMAAHEELEEARLGVRKALTALERLVSDELAAL
jgi:hypothetical protein